MDAFSGLLLQLYRQSQELPIASFQERALDKTREAVPFDSAIWVTGVMGQEGGIVHSAFTYRQPPDMMANWERIKHLDTLNFEAFSNLGQTINADFDLPGWRERVHPEVLGHIEKYGMQHTLATIVAEPVLGTFTAVSFYRSRPAKAFSESDRLFKQNLVPHLVEALKTNRFNFLHGVQRDAMQPGSARAVCDKRGILYDASNNFDDLMLSEWPSWRGPQLPGVLQERLGEPGKREFIGQNIAVRIMPVNDLFLLGVRKKSRVDQLSRREQEVAHSFSSGMDYREIAEQLKISPVTVRNHIQTIYAKLGVKNKVEMTRIIIESEH